MSDCYVKIFSSILDSSLWDLSSDTKVVFLTLLGMADPDGVVHAAIPGIARRANVSLAATEEAMAIFQSPDPYSRSTREEGRRILRVEAGWLIVNYDVYRERQPRSQQLASARKARCLAKKREEKAQGEADLREQVLPELARAGALVDVLQTGGSPGIAGDRPGSPGIAQDRTGSAEGEGEGEGEGKADTDGIESASALSASVLASVRPGGADGGHRKQLWRRLCVVVMHRAGEPPEGRDPPEYRDWWKASAARVVDAGGIADLEEWVAYVEDCRDPVARRAKDLGELSSPARWLAARARDWLRARGKSLPKAPTRA